MTPTRTQRLQTLLQELQQGETPTEGLEVSKTGDFLDEASRLSNQAVTTELLRNRSLAIKGIKHALQWLSEEPVKDSCEECGEGISPARLSALPWATRCVGCQQRQERSERDTQEGKVVRQYFNKARVGFDHVGSFKAPIGDNFLAKQLKKEGKL